MKGLGGRSRGINERGADSPRFIYHGGWIGEADLAEICGGVWPEAGDRGDYLIATPAAPRGTGYFIPAPKPPIATFALSDSS